MAELPSLRVGLSLDSATFVAETRRVNDAVSRMGRDISAHTARMERGFNLAVGAVKNFAIGLAGAVGATSLAGLARLGKQALDNAGNLRELAQQAGVATGELQALTVAGLQVGLNQEQLVTALAKFNQRVAEAAGGTGKLAELMQKYDIAVRDSSGNVRGSVDIIEDFADAIEGAGSALERGQIASEIFSGRIGSKLIPLLAAGSDGFREWMRTAEAAGLVLSPEMVRKADDASDAMATLQFAVAKGFEIGVIESFNATISTSIESLTAAREAGEFFGRAIGSAMNAGIEAFKALQPFLETTAREFRAIADLIQQVFEFTGVPFAFAEPLTVDITEGTEVLKGWNEQLADGMVAADNLGGSVDKLGNSAKTLTGEFKRLAEAGQFLKDTTAAEARALEETDERRRRFLATGGLGRLPGPVRKDLVQNLGPIAGWREELISGLPDEGELSEPFKNALESVQAEFTSTFAQMQLGGIRTFDDVADAATRIFANLNANLLSLAIFDPKFRAEMQAMSRQAGLGTHGLTAAAATSTLLPMSLQLAGAGKASQGAQYGGAVGAGIGSIFGPAGAAVGGAAGSTLGAIGYALFGPGAQSNKVRAGGPLGALASGTGAAAQFVTQLDQQLIGLLNARQQLLVDAALKAAPPTSVQYSKTPSANDLANLARGRIGPAASTLGLRPELIATGTPEQMTANLQSAIALFREIEGFRIGPVATQFRDLGDTFAEMSAEATRLGIAIDGLPEAQARATQALQRQIQLESFAIAETVGAMSPLDAALQALNVQMQQAAARAQELGVPITNIAEKHNQLARALVEQHAAIAAVAVDMREVFNLSGQVGAMSDLNVQLNLLNLEMQDAAARAQELGVPLRNVAQQHIRLAQALVRENRALEISLEGQVGNITPLQTALEQLNLEMQELYASATAAGVSTAKLAHMHGLAAAELVQQDRLQRHAVLEAVGIWTPFQRAIQDLDVQMRQASIEAIRLGISTANLAKQHNLAVKELVLQDQLQRHASFEAVGIWTPLQRALNDLNVQMQLAAIEAERLGVSTAGVTQEHQRLVAVLVREHEATIDALALSITDPFERLADPLRDFADALETSLMNPLGQMKDAGADFRRTLDLARGGDLQAIEDLRSAGERFISESGRFGASPAIAAATREVQSGLTEVLGNVSQAQREAAAGVEGHIDRAAQRQVDKLSELVAEMQQVKEEIKRLRR